MSSQSSGSEQEKGHEQFIEAVRKHEVLYKADHENYRDKNLRQKAWEQVVAECGMASIDRAKQRWGILRISLSDALKKPARQNWRYMKQMEFLIPYLGQTRKRKHLDTEDVTAVNENHYIANDWIDQNDNSHSKAAQKEMEKEYLKFAAETENNFRNQNLPKDHALHKFFIAMYKVVQKLPDSKRLNIKMNIFDIVRSTRDLVRENEAIKRSIIESNNLKVQKSKKLCLSPTNSSSSANTTSVLSNQLKTKQSKNIESELDNMTKAGTSSLNNSSNSAIFSNQLHSRSELNGISYVPIASTSTANTTFVLRNQVHNDLKTNKEHYADFSLPKSTTTTIKYSNEFEPEQTKNERSDLIITPSLPNTNLIISKVAHIEQSTYEGFETKTIDAIPIQTPKTLQNTEEDLSFINCPNSINSTSNPIRHGVFTEKENVKKESNRVHGEDATQTCNAIKNCDDTLTQIKIEKQENKEDILSLSEASCSDVEVISVEDIQIEISDGE